MSSETAKIDYVNPAVESRTTRLPVELRSGGAQSRTIGGYAAVFGRRSQPLRGFVEQVGRGFFNKSKGDGWPDVVCRFNQQDEYILGATRSGTLRLGIDATGLDYAVDLPECRGDVLEVVTRGDVGHSSFAFQTYQDEWGFADGHPLRTLLSGRLIDVAPVPSPAYLDTTVGLRSLARYVGAPIEDVVMYSECGDLRKFFVRTDIDGGKPAKPIFGPAARMWILGKRWRDTADKPPRRPKAPLSGVQARAEIMRKRYTPEIFTGTGKHRDATIRDPVTGMVRLRGPRRSFAPAERRGRRYLLSKAR
jgi:uncharacterized protein